jgi:hypothetical protein
MIGARLSLWKTDIRAVLMVLWLIMQAEMAMIF